MNKVFNDANRKVLVEMLVLFDQLPIEKQYYLLGYAQSEADKNLQGKAND